MRAAATPSKVRCNLGDVSQAFHAQARIPVQGGAAQGVVAAALPLRCEGARMLASFFNVSRVFTRGCVNEHAGVLAWNLDVQIDAV